ncbi:MAG: exo-alpha-sialidase [Cyclobacteriaceae bacterium]|nr:exo-alpha-sialidase [Cyclobacteriaceae bacterium SS2]
MNFYRFSIITLSLLITVLSSSAQDYSFLQPATVYTAEEIPTTHSILKRKFTGIPSLAIGKNGRLWATWYTGVTASEDENNYVVLATSGDQGETWEEVLVVDPDGDGPVRAYDPELWVDPTGELWLFWAQTIGHDGTVAGVWSLTTNDSGIEKAKWSEPERLTDGVMMCKPTVLSTGEWVLPASTWRKTDNSARVIVSTNKGKTWKLKGAVHVPEADRAFDEHMIIEKKDGRLWMLVRTKYGIGESYSSDKGATWEPLKPSAIKHPSARFFIRRLQSGNLLLVKHGPVDIQTKRSHLMAFLSQDDGRTWSKGLLIDGRLGVSYPDGQQMENGDIVITYDFNRTREQHILMTRFNEKDILSKDYDKRIVGIFNHRKVISDGGE